MIIFLLSSYLGLCSALPVSSGNDYQPKLVIISFPKDESQGQNHVGPSWGAAAVAEHNSRPWEDPEHDEVQDSSVNTPVSDLFEDGHDSQSHQSNKPSHLDPNIPIIGAAEMHDFPHENRPQPEEVNTHDNNYVTNSSQDNLTPTLYPFIKP